MSNGSQLQQHYAVSSTGSASGVLGTQRQMPGRRGGSDSGLHHQQLEAEAFGFTGDQAAVAIRQRSRSAQQHQSSGGPLSLPAAAHASVRWQDSRRQSSSLAEFSASAMLQVCSLLRSIIMAPSSISHDLDNLLTQLSE